jgi:glucosamine-6-phosphate deaminase
MEVRIFESKQALAVEAAREAAGLIQAAVAERGQARIVAATGAAQFEFLDALARAQGVDWAKTVFFHLDEYIGLPSSHPASFRRFLTERIIDRVHPGVFHPIDGEAPDPLAECERVAALIIETPVDVAFVGIGENTHLAFNDPPADFETEAPYLVVELDERCRRQQLGEGWFARLEDVPARAISMSVRQVLKSKHIIAIVPDRRKAEAVQRCLELEISPWRPASALRWHEATTLYLDRESASLLGNTEARQVRS